jgi:transposase
MEPSRVFDSTSAAWRRRRSVNVREVLNAIFYVLASLPMEGFAEGFPAQEHRAFLFHAVGLGRHAGSHPRRALRDGARSCGTRGEPYFGDPRQPKRQGRSKGGFALDPQGYDGGKKVTGRKRYILVDTLGLLLSASVLSGDIQDRDGARGLLRAAPRRLPFITRIFADGGYQGPKMRKVVAATGCWNIEIVKRSDIHHFVVLPKRWIVERTFARISRSGRLARDFEPYQRPSPPSCISQ